MNPAAEGSDAERPRRGVQARLSVTVSNVALIAARVASMGLGFVAWLVAARIFAPAEVGIASALVASMMLCVQFCLLGIGSAAVAILPSHRGAPAHIVDVGATVVLASVLGVMVVYFILAATVLTELSIVITPAYALVFVAMTAFGTLNTYFDYVWIALRRGDQVLVRNIAFGAATIAVLALVASVLPGARGSLIIIIAWASAGLAACTIAVVQLARALGRRPALRWDPSLARRMIGVGWPNWLLTLAERAPALAMPILVAQFLGPTTNAFWYAAWMMGWVILIIPISIGQSTFAEASRQPADSRAAMLHGLRSSLAIGVPAGALLALVAELALSLLGPQYAAGSAAALRLLVIGVVPVTVIQAYYAVGRARGALTEAIVVGAAGGAATVAFALAAGLLGGLVAMAAAWVVAQCAIALWAAIRLFVMYRARPASGGSRPEAIVS